MWRIFASSETALVRNSGEVRSTNFSQARLDRTVNQDGGNAAILFCQKRPYSFAKTANLYVQGSTSDSVQPPQVGRPHRDKRGLRYGGDLIAIPLEDRHSYSQVPGAP